MHSDFAGVTGDGDETSKFQTLIDYCSSNGLRSIYVKDDAVFTVTALSDSTLVNFIGTNSRFSTWPYTILSPEKDGEFTLPIEFYDYFPSGKVIGYLV